MLTIWLDATGAEYTLKYEMAHNKPPVLTVAVYHTYWKSFSATDHATLVDMVQEIKQFLKQMLQ